MSDEYATIVYSAITATLTSGGAIWLLRHWLGERIRQSIIHEYAQRLEVHKAEVKTEHDLALERFRSELSREAEVRSTASRAFSDSHGAAYNRRLDAIQATWNGVIELRKNAPSLLILLDIYMPDDYPKMLKEVASCRDEVGPARLTEWMASGSAAVETARPFSGEYIYSLFFVYRAILGRLSVLLYDGQRLLNRPWYEDGGIKSLATSVLTGDERRQFDEHLMHSPLLLMRSVERMILEAMERVISGSASADAGVERAEEIMKAAEAVESRRADRTEARR